MNQPTPARGLPALAKKAPLLSGLFGIGLALFSFCILDFAFCTLHSPCLAAEEQLPPFQANEHNRKLVRHSGVYPPFRIVWTRETRLAGATGVFPHPVLPEVVALTTGAGLVLSNDAGRTWRPLPEAAAQKLGAIRHLAFDPRSADAFYLATDGKGIWATADGGKSFRQAGSKAAGMAADSALAVYVYPTDMRFLTLLAVHGDAAPGISLTEDGGAAWRVMAPDYFVWKLLCSGTDYVYGKGTFAGPLYMAAAKKDAPDVQGIYACGSLGEPWFVAVRDVVPTDAAMELLGDDPYWATADSGLYRITHKGADFLRVGPPELSRWPSLGVTWGAHADAQLLFAYEPARLGMAVSTDGLKTFTAHSQGLYTSPYVREGARLRANANGTVFYAVANGILSRGERFDGALRVSRVAVTPPVVAFARRTWAECTWRLHRAIKVLADDPRAAEAARPIAAAGRNVKRALSAEAVTVAATVLGKPKSVTVDLSRLGGSPWTPLFDDGQHGDGAAADGVYAASFPIDPKSIDYQHGDWRPPWPGPVPLTVTAVAPDGSLAGTVGILLLLSQPESFLYWSEDDPRPPDVRDTQGKVAIALDDQSFSPYASTRSWRLTAGPGPWLLPIGSPYRLLDITGYYALSFWVKSAAPRPDDLRVQLRDQPTYAFSTTTPPAAIVAERLIEGGAIDGQFRRVVIPLSRLLKDAPAFQTRLFCWILFSGEGRAPATYWIDDLRFFLSKEDLESDIAQALR